MEAVPFQRINGDHDEDSAAAKSEVATAAGPQEALDVSHEYSKLLLADKGTATRIARLELLPGERDVLALSIRKMNNLVRKNSDQTVRLVSNGLTVLVASFLPGSLG